MELEKLASIPAVIVGLGLLYVGLPEQNPLTLFFFVLLGLLLIVAGFALVLGYRTLPAPPTVLRRAPSEFESGEEAEPSQKGAGPKAAVHQLRHCPNCGAPILSAGKFCGTCGKVIK